MDAVKQGASMFYIKSNIDIYGRKTKCPQKYLATCKDCAKVNTDKCLLGKVNPNMDYCSRFEFNKEM